MNASLWILIGFIVGASTFFFLESGKPSNSFFNTCWIRQQPQWIVHSKVYLLGGLLIWRAVVHSDVFLMLLGSSWIGLHLFQDLAERFHEKVVQQK
jgi:hypothetical protein